MALNPLGRKLDKNGAPIVTREELDKSGMSLRDFLNKERGLKSREETVGQKNAKEGMSGTIMDPAKGAEANKMFKLEGARDRALAMAEGERAVTAHKAKQVQQKEADEAASLGTDYKKGGKVSSASSRGDGIASRGKTKGKMVTMKRGGKTC
jgi:hypothetical protein